MSEIQNYATGIDDPSSRRYETFSYLPPMSDAQIRRQVEYIVAQRWQPAIEHTESERTASSYWYMWKLPMFGESDVDRILAEAQACHEAHPGHHVRLIGYDPIKQSQGAAMVVYRAQA